MMKSTIDTVFNDKFHLKIVDENLSALGFSTNHKQVIYMVLSAILNLGNIQFDTSTNDDSHITVDSQNFLCNASALLKVDELELKDVLTSHTRGVGKLEIKYSFFTFRV